MNASGTPGNERKHLSFCMGGHRGGGGGDGLQQGGGKHYPPTPAQVLEQKARVT